MATRLLREMKAAEQLEILLLRVCCNFLDSEISVKRNVNGRKGLRYNLDLLMCNFHPHTYNSGPSI